MSQLSTCSDRWTSAAKPSTTLNSRLSTRTLSALSAHMRVLRTPSARSAQVVSMVVSLSGTCKYNNNNNTIMHLLLNFSSCQPSTSVLTFQPLSFVRCGSGLSPSRGKVVSFCRFSDVLSVCSSSISAHGESPKSFDGSRNLSRACPSSSVSETSPLSLSIEPVTCLCTTISVLEPVAGICRSEVGKTVLLDLVSVLELDLRLCRLKWFSIRRRRSLYLVTSSGCDLAYMARGFAYSGVSVPSGWNAYAARR